MIKLIITFIGMILAMGIISSIAGMFKNYMLKHHYDFMAKWVARLES